MAEHAREALLYDGPRRPMSPEALQAAPPPRTGAPRPERYRVLFPLGRGGMGSVEVALEEQGTFRRIVALKTMLTESSRDQRQQEMFLREARLARMLNHPNVVHAFAAGAEDERLYICMEYVEGTSLSLLLARAREQDGGLSPALTAYLLAELCDGLHAAHEATTERGEPLGVVHRDVSPQNVMVGQDGVARVVDFGVAKAVGRLQTTRDGEVKGKTAYMAPEQALGDALDRRSDLFAVGAILYECIAGSRMWGPGSDVDVMRRLALDEAPRLGGTVPGAPVELAKLQARLVARDPAARPATAAEVADALRRFLATCSPGADESTLRATMERLFTLEAAQRRHQLARALEGVVDRAGADALKKSLSTATAPLSDDERRMVAQLRPRRPSTTPLESEASVPPPPRRSPLPAVALIAALVGAGALLLLKMASPSPAAADNGAGASPPQAATTEAPITPTQAASAASAPVAAAAPAASAGTSVVGSDAGAAVRPKAAPPHPRPQAPSTPSSPSPSKRPDIDTHAF